MQRSESFLLHTHKPFSDNIWVNYYLKWQSSSVVAWQNRSPFTRKTEGKILAMLFKSLGSVRFLIFFKEQQGCIYFIKNTEKNNTIVKYMMHSWIFSIITPVFSVTWSSEIILICWFAAQETFLIIINVENSFLTLTFLTLLL